MIVNHSIGHLYDQLFVGLLKGISVMSNTKIPIKKTVFGKFVSPTYNGKYENGK